MMTTVSFRTTMYCRSLNTRVNRYFLLNCHYKRAMVSVISQLVPLQMTVNYLKALNLSSLSKGIHKFHFYLLDSTLLGLGELH